MAKHVEDDVPTEPTSPIYSHPTPSIRLLFSCTTRRDFFLLLLPAIFVSLAAGGIAPFMTQVIGQAFNAYAKFPVGGEDDPSAKDHLLSKMRIVTLELVGLAAGALTLSSVMSSLWLWVGERIVMRLRQQVFVAVTSRDMEWFDLLGQTKADGEEESAGAGGLMAKFTRDTDDVRSAVSLNSGMLIQHLTTFIACLVLAFMRSWSLTLVILSAIPLMIFVQALSQALAAPSYDTERANTSSAATRIDRAVASIATVKAFNAQKREMANVTKFVDAAQAAYRKCCTVWGITGGSTQFILYAMFVQAFWYGSKLVRDDKVSPGDVLAVFWACLTASSNLQMCIPLLVILTKGKSAMVSLQVIIDPPPREATLDEDGLTPITPIFPPAFRPRDEDRITPSRCLGTFDIHDITFAYPSRPTIPVLDIKSPIYIAGNDLTFIVGGSGSGKSTIAQLLMRMYEPTSGSILFDEQDIHSLSETFLREHIALVSQECILFDMSVHDNVAIGMAGSSWKRPDQVTREEVEKACQVAMVHDFVRDLPNGYDTMLGNSGSNLSGGQRQRIAIARAVMRDPTVLILDEATSALDATSRVLVFEAIKQSRRKKTTVVITHDLSQITPEDFVYVMREGCVVEEGFREELEKDVAGEFRATLDKQFQTGGFPVKDLPDVYGDAKAEAAQVVERVLNKQDDSSVPKKVNVASRLSVFAGRQSFIAPPLGASSAPWEIDAIQDIMGPSRPPPMALHKKHLSSTRLRGRYLSSAAMPTSFRQPAHVQESSQTLDVPALGMNFENISTASLPPTPSANRVTFGWGDSLGRRSLTFEPSHLPSPTSFRRNSVQSTTTSDEEDVEDDEDFANEKYNMQIVGAEATRRRAAPRSRINWDSTVTVDTDAAHPSADRAMPEEDKQEPVPSMISIIRQYYHTVPGRGMIIFGLFMCVINGALTPVFSFLLARLLAQVGNGAHDISAITTYALLVLLTAFADGIANGLQFFILENAAMKWVVSLRKRCFALVMQQDKAWFDESGHSAERIVQILVKDGDDARNLIATIMGQFTIVFVMVLVGIVWALYQGWQLTLLGLAIGPIFAVAMMLQTTVVGKFEVRNKRAREDVARRYYEAVSNVRPIRSMALESVFRRHFDESLEVAMKTGVQGAFVAGLGYGVANSLIYLAEALLFYVGAVLMAQGTYSYLRLLEVLNLVVFSVTIAAQLLTFVPKIAKAKQAAADFGKILALDTNTQESHGSSRFPITGDITFDDVHFSYAQRPDVPVLNGVSCTIQDGECVAIVGASGCGKSTMASLLQRLYEPTAGHVRIGKYNLADADSIWLRDHVAVVSQHAALFDATVTENICYGCDVGVPVEEVERAARDANIHDFIMSLPKGYDTMLGENASLVSGGQAQRLQIARALVNGRANILIFDECTSALDSTNQAAVMNTVMKVKKGRTALVITHKLPVMEMCDRILVVHEGRFVESGTYDELIRKRGVFFSLANAGEWADFD